MPASKPRLAMLPMLGKKWEGWEGSVCYSQPKIDGIRALASASGFYSRNENAFRLPALRQALRHFFKRHPRAVLDGELWVPNSSFGEVTSAVRSGCDKLQFHVFDAAMDGEFWQRWEWVSSMLPESETVRLVPTKRIRTLASLNAAFETYLRQGYEGQMVRQWECYYIPTRSSHLRKRKLFVSDEFRILSVHEGKGGRVGAVGAFGCSTRDGEFFRVNATADARTLRRWWRERTALIGKVVTVNYFELTDRGVPRFPTSAAVREFA